ncbi:MAG: hypothetical protein QM765_20865 [Myxococcales bacterium]
MRIAVVLAGAVSAVLVAHLGAGRASAAEPKRRPDASKAVTLDTELGSLLQAMTTKLAAGDRKASTCAKANEAARKSEAALSPYPVGSSADLKWHAATSKWATDLARLCRDARQESVDADENFETRLKMREKPVSDCEGKWLLSSSLDATAKILRAAAKSLPDAEASNNTANDMYERADVFAAEALKATKYFHAAGCFVVETTGP